MQFCLSVAVLITIVKVTTILDWIFIIIPFYLTISFSLIVLTQTKRYAFFMPTLPCLVSFCQAFPPLYEDIMSLLIQIGQVCASDVATQTRDFDPIITRK